MSWVRVVHQHGANFLKRHTFSNHRRFMSTFNVAILQLQVGAEKQSNINNAVREINAAVEKSTNRLDLLMLPEVWNGPYLASEFPKYCEPIPDVGSSVENSKSLGPIAAVAQQHKVTIVAGSIPEEEKSGESSARIYNTSVVLSGEDGRVLAKHRKVHLFDIDIPGKITFKESETLTGGSGITTVDVPWYNKNSDNIRIGLAICYDIRFPELILLMRERGAEVMCFPAAFNTTTGPRHWHLCQRARAVDTQCFVLSCSPARNDTGYQAYGHSLAINPWGEILVEAEEKPTTLYASLNLEEIEAARSGIPIGFQRRKDVYSLSEVPSNKL